MCLLLCGLRSPKHAEANGLEWKGCFYDPDNWNAGDDLNRALSAASSCSCPNADLFADERA